MTIQEIEYQAKNLRFDGDTPGFLFIESTLELSDEHRREWVEFLKRGYPSREIVFRSKS